MKGLKLILCIVIVMTSQFIQAQSKFGVGLRFGDPAGLTLKKYMGTKALELNIGRTHLWGRGEWYGNRFNNWYNGKHFGYKDFNYISYGSSMPLSVQLHLLFHKPINQIGNESTNGLSWYYGLGMQFRHQKYWFDYRYKVEGNPNWFYATGESITDLDIGADGVIGLEYGFKKVPVSIFTDLTLFMEVIDNPFLFWFQGGIGARYNF